MGAHQAVLLTSSKSVHLRRRVLSLRIAPVSPLFSALAKSAQPSHSTQFSFPLFSCTYELFCTGEKLNSFLFMRFRTLYQKHPGWGWALFDHHFSKRASRPADIPHSSTLAPVFSVASVLIPILSFDFRSKIPTRSGLSIANLRKYSLPASHPSLAARIRAALKGASHV